jgi:hypothetical protein
MAEASRLKKGWTFATVAQGGLFALVTKDSAGTYIWVSTVYVVWPDRYGYGSFTVYNNPAEESVSVATIFDGVGALPTGGTMSFTNMKGPALVVFVAKNMRKALLACGSTTFIPYMTSSNFQYVGNYGTYYSILGKRAPLVDASPPVALIGQLPTTQPQPPVTINLLKTVQNAPASAAYGYELESLDGGVSSSATIAILGTLLGIVAIVAIAVPVAMYERGRRKPSSA